MGSIDRAGPAQSKTVVIPGQKYPEACVWQPTSNLLVLFKFFVGYSFLVSRPICPARGWGVIWLVISLGLWAGGVCFLVLHVGGHLDL